jgi:lipopolysaccharide export LptBFGC system permease protein LptF
MRLLDRYLLRELLVPLGFCLGGFFVFWLSFDLLGQLSGFQQRGLGFSEIARYYWYAVPELLGTVMPVGLLLAMLFALTNLTRHHEITAIRAAGISLWRLCLPYLGLGLLCVLGLQLLNEYVAPGFREAQEALFREARGESGANPWKERIDIENRTDRRVWNIGAFNEVTGEMRSPRVRLPLAAGAKRILMARGLTWTNGQWAVNPRVTESVYRSATDDSPALREVLMREFPALNLPPASVEKWEGSDLTVLVPVVTLVTNAGVRTNVIVQTPVTWRTNLVATAPDGLTWRIGAMDPVRGELKDVRVEVPSEPGAWRLVIGETARWTGESWAFVRVTEYLFRGATDSDPASAVHPELVVNELTESPEVVRAEIRINALSRGRTMKRAELTLAEIRNYRRLHPVVRSDLRATLDTQWHARLAGPWTCLVVVVIAVPFSVAPGRRNLFYGVAGSIGIAFVFFVLQKLGFALGQSGRVPGWAGAWLPNAFFATLGIVLTNRVP